MTKFRDSLTITLKAETLDLLDHSCLICLKETVNFFVKTLLRQAG